MKITIDTKVLKKYNLSLGGFLTLLLGYYEVDIGSMQLALKDKGLAAPDLFRAGSIVLSDNTRNLVTRIITESDDKVANCNLDFEKLSGNIRSLSWIKT